jgi:hypoxanthine phosphoribosyltransferase
MPPRSKSLWQSIRDQFVDKAGAWIATLAIGAVGGGAITFAWFKTAIALHSVVNCVAEVKTWLDKEDFRPQVFVTGWSGGLIMTELLIQELYDKSDQLHPPTYVLYQLAPNSTEEKYKEHGVKFVSPSTKLQFFVPNALQSEDRNSKILIVADWVNTGNTVRATQEAIGNLKFTQVKTAVVAGSDKVLTKELRPDHVCYEVEGPWDKLPWRTRKVSF